MLLDTALLRYDPPIPPASVSLPSSDRYQYSTHVIPYLIRNPEGRLWGLCIVFLPRFHPLLLDTALLRYDVWYGRNAFGLLCDKRGKRVIVIPYFIRNPEGRLNGWRGACLALLLAVPVFNADSVFYFLPVFSLFVLLNYLLQNFF